MRVPIKDVEQESVTPIKAGQRASDGCSSLCGCGLQRDESEYWASSPKCMPPRAAWGQKIQEYCFLASIQRVLLFWEEPTTSVRSPDVAWTYLGYGPHVDALEWVHDGEVALSADEHSEPDGRHLRDADDGPRVHADVALDGEEVRALRLQLELVIHRQNLQRKNSGRNCLDQ